MVLPSEEEGVLAGLKPKNIPIKRLTINPEKVKCDVIRRVVTLVVGPSSVVPLKEHTVTLIRWFNLAKSLSGSKANI